MAFLLWARISDPTVWCLAQSSAACVFQVETYDGFRATAKAFVSGSLALLTSEVVPTERYMMVLRDGAAEQYLDPLWQAWLSSIETRPSAGLGMEYYDTPAKFLAYGFLAIVALVVVGFFAQH